MLVSIAIRREDEEHNMINCMEKLVKETAGHRKIKFILTSAFYSIQYRIKKKFEHNVILPSIVPQKPITYNDHEFIELAHNKTERSASPKSTPQRDSARDLYVFSLGDVHIFTPGNGFSMIGALLRIRQKDQYRIHNRCSIEVTTESNWESLAKMHSLL